MATLDELAREVAEATADAMRLSMLWQLSDKEQQTTESLEASMREGVKVARRIADVYARVADAIEQELLPQAGDDPAD
jgi:hypothetical protein